MVLSFDQCNDSCGWTAGIIAALSYGSFGVPIKETKHIDVHPLVLQSYKTIVVFLSCWFVTLLDVDVAFTGWGILSGFMWVVGGTGGIYAIRMAGLAIAVGTWASIMVMVNFIFGILVFHEPVHDIWGTMGAFSLLILGLIGMSHYSAPQQQNNKKSSTTTKDDDILNESNNKSKCLISQTTKHDDDHLLSRPPHDDDVRNNNNNNQNDRFNDDSEQHFNDYWKQEEENSNKVENDYNDDDNTTTSSETSSVASGNVRHVVLLGGRLSLTKRQCGILGAVWNGFFTGGSLVPLHYAKQQGFGGARYMISMSCGAFISNILIWVVMFCFQMKSMSTYSISKTYQAMPRWHFEHLLIPGFIAGILLAIAMFGSILSVTYLGQGVGNSLVQTKILVSGLWGIVWYKEITGTSVVVKWFTAATTTVVAIIWLSLERIHAGGAGGGGH